jgi:hypothetical protein
MDNILKKYKEIRDVDEEDRSTILSLKDKGLMKIAIDVKRDKLMAKTKIIF